MKGMRKLGIPTVIDRTIQQAIAQQLIPLYEPLFIETSYGYRPNKSAKDAIQKVKEYAEQGYTFAVTLDLSKYFDTLNHEKLINLLRKEVKDERVIQLIKRYLKSGVMENGVVITAQGHAFIDFAEAVCSHLGLEPEQMARRISHVLASKRGKKHE